MPKKQWHIFRFEGEDPATHWKWIVRHGSWKCLDLLWPVRCRVESWCRWGLWRSCCYACGGLLDWRHESTNFMRQSPWPLEIFPKFLSPLSNASMWFIRCSTLKNLSSPCFFGYPLFSRFLSSNVIRSTFALASGLGYSEKLSQRAQALEALSRQTFMLASFPRSSHVLPGQASISQLPSSRPRFLPLNCGTPIEILQASKSGVLASASSKMTSFWWKDESMKMITRPNTRLFSEFVSPKFASTNQPTPRGCDGWSRCVWADLPDGGEANEKMCVEAVTVTLLEAANGGIALLFDWEMPAGGSEINEIMISQIHSCGWLHSWLPLEKSGGLELSDADEAKKFLQTKNAFVASWLWNQVLKVLEAESDAKPPEAVRFAANWTAKTQNGRKTFDEGLDLWWFL